MRRIFFLKKNWFYSFVIKSTPAWKKEIHLFFFVILPSMLQNIPLHLIWLFFSLFYFIGLDSFFFLLWNIFSLKLKNDKNNSSDAKLKLKFWNPFTLCKFWAQNFPISFICCCFNFSFFFLVCSFARKKELPWMENNKKSRSNL